MARFLAQEGLLGQNGPVGADLSKVRLPEGIKEVIWRRLNRLSDSANDVLTIAAIVGRDFTLAQLSAVTTDTPRDRLIEILDEAMSANAIHESPNELETFQFSHALVQQTLRDELTLTNRVRMHARVAESLEEHYGDEAEDHAAELALHFELAQTVLGAEKLIHYSVAAGEQALVSFGYEDALRHFQKAEIAAEDEVGVDDTQMAGILGGIVKAWTPLPTNIAARQTSWAVLGRAFDLYIGLGEHESAVDLATEPIGPLGASEALDIIRRALELVEPDSEKAGLLQIRLAVAMMFRPDDFDGARASLASAIVIARGYGNPSLEARALATLALLESQAARSRECIDAGMAAMHLAGSANDHFTQVRVPFSMSGSLLAVGDPDSARMLLDANVFRCRRFHQQGAGASTAIGLFLSALMCGNQEARVEAVSLAEEFGLGPGTPGRELADWWDKHALGGRQNEEVEALLRLLRRDRSGFLGGPAIFAAPVIELMRTAATAELLEAADSLAHELRSTPPQFPSVTNVADLLMGCLAVARADQKAAAELYDSVLPRRGQANVAASVANDHMLALLARTAGRPDEAVTHFEDALGFCRNAGYRPELAWTCSDYAEMLIERDGPGDRDRVLELLDEAVAIAVEPGMGALEKRLLVLRGRVELMYGQAAPYPDGLTKREVDVLRLVADGMSNREIGEALFISENTVIRHVSNIFGKAGFSNRAEATAYAIRLGIAKD